MFVGVDDDVDDEDASGSTIGWVEDTEDSAADEIDTSEVACGASVSVALDMKEVERISSSDCVIIGCPSGLT
jgi:hypothetical protein